MLDQSAMRRLTASLLMLLFSLSICAPAVLAIAVTPQHKCCADQCCLRKGRHTHVSSGASVQARPCCSQDCGCSQTVPQWADIASLSGESLSHPSSILQYVLIPLLHVKSRHAAHSVRGPPSFSIA